MALLHLVALALLGDMETLRCYQKSFTAGARLGFDVWTKSATFDERLS
ncbi:DUF6990 domain-containing protein [Bartonella phoceensis]|nr:hypothetical protein [Bartonella phoceensis]